MHNKRLHKYINSLSEETLLTSVCTGSLIYGKFGILDGIPATSRKEPDKLEASPLGRTPIEHLEYTAPKCKISTKRIVDAGRIITGAGISSGMEMGIHILKRAGYDSRK